MRDERVESDRREERLRRVVRLYAQITAATREFLAAVAACDRHRDWAAEGFGSCAEWLAWRVGLGRNAATERVRVARALEGLPRTSAAMSRGEISFSKVRALTRVATEASEAELLDLARAGSTAHLERVVRAWKAISRDDEQTRERLLHGTRRFNVAPDGEGMYVVRGRLTPEVAAALMRAVEAASDVLYASAGEDDREEVDPAQRRADAIGLLAERALEVGFGGEAGWSDDASGSAHGVPGSSDEPRISGSRAARYQVVVHVDRKTLDERGEPGRSELEDGTRVSAETARRIACDASVVEVEEGGDGTALDVGRRTRSVPPAIRRALEARDRGCRFPGCGSRFTDAHHIRHWADGGATKLNNLVLLCRRHHRRVHEEGWRVCSDRDGVEIVFFTPRGKALAPAPPMSDGDGCVSDGCVSDGCVSDVPGSNARGSDARGSVQPPFGDRSIDWRALRPACRRDHDIPWELEAAAWDALDPADAA